MLLTVAFILTSRLTATAAAIAIRPRSAAARSNVHVSRLQSKYFGKRLWITVAATAALAGLTHVGLRAETKQHHTGLGRGQNED